MAAYFCSSSGPSGEGGDDAEGARDPGKGMRDMMGPGMVDQMIRNALQQCWMILPPERKTVETVSAEIRRIVDRALKDLNDDARAFGMTSE